MKGEGSIYSQRGRGMDDSDARIGESLWRVRMCQKEAQSMCKVGCNMGVTNGSE